MVAAYVFITIEQKLLQNNFRKTTLYGYVHVFFYYRCPLGGCSNEKPIELSDLEENKELKRYIDRKNRQAKKGR